MDQSKVTSLETSKTLPHSVSLTLQSLQHIKIHMMETLSPLSDKDCNIHSLRETNKESISGTLYGIKEYIEKEIENISDLIFSLSEVVLTERSLDQE